VLAEIPSVGAAADIKAERRRLWLGWATAAFVTVTILVGSAFSYLRG
jgi:hypothetical protein